MTFLQKFLHLEAASGILLAACTLVALVIANSPLNETYTHALNFTFFSLTLHHWINDGLMAIFFFVVGMEIKHELVVGELSTPKKAGLPILAAIGGMLFPAAIYHFFNLSGPAAHGWGIPMATDIAFAVSLLSVFGKRVPFSLKVFLLALAIVDDLGAVLVIAFFYTQKIAFLYLLAAAGVFLLIYLARIFRFRCYATYIALGTAAWFFFLRSGVHATVAGVILGFLTPLGIRNDEGRIESPLNDLVELLHPFVNFLIMPIFALANAGVDLRGNNFGELIAHPVSLGIGFGLIFGKPIGIVLLSWLGTLLKIAELPKGLRWSQIAGVGLVGGIGFTMALFIGGLALPAELEMVSKAGILVGSSVAALAGAGVLFFVLDKPGTHRD
ncbi:MAG: Na+/H+ antiporter NhaA [Bacteriovoracia bacterium]